jgi:hypothetical protein
MLDPLQVGPTALWGFLVGFVGWGACFRIAEPVASWLLENADAGTAPVAIVRLLVTLFSILAVLVALALIPLLLLAVARHMTETQAAEFWRSLYGVSFVSSLVGLFALGIVRRMAK